MIIGIEVSHANKEQRTGVENVCLALTQELKKQIPSATEVILYSNKPLGRELSGIPINWQAKILYWPFKKMWSQVRLSFELLFHPPDIFFAPGQLIPFFCPKKTIAIIHDSAFLFYPEAYNFWGRQYLKWMNKRIIKKSWKIITSSEFNKDEIKKYYGDKAAEKVVVIPFAYDSQKFKIITEDKKEILEKYKITKSYIISIGRLEKKKNTVNIIKAFNILKKYQDIQLVLIGNPGVGYDEVEGEIQKSPYKNDIIRPGWVGGDDVPYLLNKAQVFVFPSLYEGFGLPVLEAMACGCPVVAGDLPSLHEVGGEAALYADSNSAVDIAEKISEVITGEKRVKIVSEGLEHVQDFSWEYTVKKIISLF